MTDEIARLARTALGIARYEDRRMLNYLLEMVLIEAETEAERIQPKKRRRLSRSDRSANVRPNSRPP